MANTPRRSRRRPDSVGADGLIAAVGGVDPAAPRHREQWRAVAAEGHSLRDGRDAAGVEARAVNRNVLELKRLKKKTRVLIYVLSRSM